MIGMLYALLAGLFISIRALAEKKILEQVDEFFLAWCIRFFGALFVWIAFFFFGFEIIIQDVIFWKVLVLGGIMNSISSVFVLKALKVTDLSLLAPLSTITPIFVLITAPIILGEFPTIMGMTGVILIVSGAYTLNIKERKNGYFAPFRSLLNNKGVWYMLGAVVMWSIGINIDKIGLGVSSPILWTASLQTIVAIILTPFVLTRKKLLTPKAVSKKVIFFLPLIGLIAAIASLFWVYAVSMILVVYASSLKRVNIIFEVFMGKFILKEKGFKERLLGVLIMILGTLLISFS